MKTIVPPPDDGPPPPPNPDDGGGRGRPSKLTPELVRAFARALFAGNYKTDACKLLNVSTRTFQRWMKQGRKYPQGIYGDFCRAVVAAETRAKSNALAEILAQGRTDAKHLCWWLERKYPRQFGQLRGETGELKRRIRQLEKILGDGPEIPPETAE